MLENLDSVDWAKLGHGYGEATDVPRQLRALASGHDKERQKALWDLHGNIWHQGTVYEATAVAVPFLLEMLKDDHPAPESILVLLALIATSNYFLFHRSPSFVSSRMIPASASCLRTASALAKSRDLRAC